jgi:hypothetical protein
MLEEYFIYTEQTAAATRCNITVEDGITLICIRRRHFKIADPLRHAFCIIALKQRDTGRLKRAEMKFIQLTAGYSLLDHRRNGDILEEIKVDTAERVSTA